MVAIVSSKTQATNYQTTRRKIPENSNLHQHRFDSLKSLSVARFLLGYILRTVLFPVSLRSSTCDALSSFLRTYIRRTSGHYMGTVKTTKFSTSNRVTIVQFLTTSFSFLHPFPSESFQRKNSYHVYSSFYHVLTSNSLDPPPQNGILVQSGK